MEELREIEVVRAVSEWLQNAKTLDVMRSQPRATYEKLPSLSVQAEVAVAVKFLGEVREKSKDGKNFAFVNVELIEPAVLWEKEKANYEAPKGTKATMNIKRHADLYRSVMRLTNDGKVPLQGQEVVIANLGKRTFETPNAPSGKATGFQYSVMLLADLKKKLGKK